MRLTRNQVSPHGFRGFESLPLRHFIRKNGVLGGAAKHLLCEGESAYCEGEDPGDELTEGIGPPSSRVFSPAETRGGSGLPAEVANRGSSFRASRKRAFINATACPPATPPKQDHFLAARAGKRSSRCVLPVPVAEGKKRLSVASHYRRVGNFSEGQPPCVVFPKSPAILCRPPLKPGANCSDLGQQLSASGFDVASIEVFCNRLARPLSAASSFSLNGHQTAQRHAPLSRHRRAHQLGRLREQAEQRIELPGVLPVQPVWAGGVRPMAAARWDLDAKGGRMGREMRRSRRVSGNAGILHRGRRP